MYSQHTVALLAEGVDRNTLIGADGNTYYVALLAEGVDRNMVLDKGENNV